MKEYHNAYYEHRKRNLEVWCPAFESQKPSWVFDQLGSWMRYIWIMRLLLLQKIHLLMSLEMEGLSGVTPRWGRSVTRTVTFKSLLYPLDVSVPLSLPFLSLFFLSVLRLPYLFLPSPCLVLFLSLLPIFRLPGPPHFSSTMLYAMMCCLTTAPHTKSK